MTTTRDIFRETVPALNRALVLYNSDIPDEEREQVEKDLIAYDSVVEEKCDAITEHVAATRSQIERLDAEIDRLKAMRDREKNAEVRLRKLQFVIMSAAGKEKFKTDFHEYRIAESKFVITDDSLSLDWCVTKTETKPDKERISKALKAGEEIPGARIETNRYVVVK